MEKESMNYSPSNPFEIDQEKKKKTHVIASDWFEIHQFRPVQKTTFMECHQILLKASKWLQIRAKFDR